MKNEFKKMTLETAVNWCKNHSSVINVKSNDEYNILMDFLESKGYKWSTGIKLSDENVYANYENDTCIFINNRGDVSYNYSSYYEGFTIIELCNLPLQTFSFKAYNGKIISAKYNNLYDSPSNVIEQLLGIMNNSK